MSVSLRSDFLFRLFRLAQKRPVRHSLAWIGIFALLILTDTHELGTAFTISKSLLVLASYMVIVYFNLYYLISNYLSQKTFLVYSLLLLLVVGIVSVLRALVLYIMYSGFPVYQEYIFWHIDDMFYINMSIAAGSTLLKIFSDWMRHQRDKKELETQTMQSEIRFLKSQINPHFLFNTLNSLYALTLKKSDTAPEIVIKLSEMMRYMLYECNERRVPLRKEVNYLQNYIDLEKLRQGQHGKISFQIRGEVKDQQIAPLLFIPFLENSFKHGLNAQLNEGFVHIILEIRDNIVELKIENSKPASQPLRIPGPRSGGIGLVNVRRRLDLLYPETYKLQIKDAPDAYKINLILNLDH